MFVGTLYPLALEALTGEKISVGAPFFNLTFGPLFVPLLLAVPFGPLLAWKRGDLLGVAQRLIGAAGAAAIVAHRRDVRPERGGPVLAPFGIGLALFVMAGAMTDLVERTGLLRVPFATALARARGLPRSAWGTMFAHFGLGVTLLGIVGETHLGRRAHRRGEARADRLDPRLRSDLRRPGAAPGSELPRAGRAASPCAQTATFVGVMEPSKRTFPSRGSRPPRPRC